METEPNQPEPNLKPVQLKSLLKRRHADEPELIEKKKRKLNFNGVTVYYFPRIQGFTCVPSQGGSTLGMSSKHTLTKQFTLNEHEAEQKRVHRSILKRLKNEQLNEVGGDGKNGSDPIAQHQNELVNGNGFNQHELNLVHNGHAAHAIDQPNHTVDDTFALKCTSQESSTQYGSPSWLSLESTINHVEAGLPFQIQPGHNEINEGVQLTCLSQPNLVVTGVGSFEHTSSDQSFGHELANQAESYTGYHLSSLPNLNEVLNMTNETGLAHPTPTNSNACSSSSTQSLNEPLQTNLELTSTPLPHLQPAPPIETLLPIDSPTTSETSDSSSTSSLEDTQYYFLQPVPTRQRRQLLRESGIKLDSTEKDTCKSIRSSREFCGCDCKSYCDESCLCVQNGIKCQVDRLSFPCACTRLTCTNPQGRIEFNPIRVRTHFIHTIMRIELEKKFENHASWVAGQDQYYESTYTNGSHFQNMSNANQTNMTLFQQPNFGIFNYNYELNYHNNIYNLINNQCNNEYSGGLAAGNDKLVVSNLVSEMIEKVVGME